MNPYNQLISLYKKINWDTLVQITNLAVIAAVLVIAVPGARPQVDGPDYQALGIARNHLFNFADWEAGALADKMAITTLSPQQYMTEEEQVACVRNYLQLVYDIAQYEIQVQDIYLNPEIADPEAASAGLRAERDTLRAQQIERQALAEAIIEAQVAEMLAEYGFGTAGQILPPVAIRFTRLPTLLIVSPRDRIERIGAYPLEHGLTVDEMERIESDVDQSLDASSLIVPLGGLAVYPAMLIETGYAPHVYDISAHEWTHHYLSFYTLGMSYGQSGEINTINETVASIIGTEIGWALMDRYYPDLAPPPPDWAPKPPSQPQQQAEPTFNFRAKMHETRIRADELLAAGQIEEAEKYMEERRIMFVEQGYRIRKLNQAYFAFYGAYADQPGATGADPIGPALRELRYYSPSLYDFLITVRSLTSLEEIQQAVEEARHAVESGR